VNFEEIEEKIGQPVIDQTLPLPHILIRLIRAGTTFFMASRGSFKTSRGIALYILDMVYEMPRSSGVLIGLSFEHLGDNTLPPLLTAFRDLGFIEGQHFVVGTKAPEWFERPYLSVYKDKFDHVISFHNGTVIHLVSLAKKASANGISAQWGVFDEAKFMKEKELVDEIFPIFRGNEKHFKNSAGYLSKFFATDKLADPSSIKWLLNKKKLNNPQKNEIVISLALRINELKIQLLEAGINKSKELLKEIEEIDSVLGKLRQNMTLYIESSGLDTEKIMGRKWLRDKKMSMTPYEFNIAIMNKDPDRPGVGFYPKYQDDVHRYNADHSVVDNLPFIFGADYQHSVAPVVAAQLKKVDGILELDYQDAVFTLPPDSLSSAIDEWSRLHNKKSNRLVYYVFDQTAIGKRPEADSYMEIVTKSLRRNKWIVKHIYTGSAPLHFNKYENTQEWMDESAQSDVRIRINGVRAEKLIISIKGAGAKTNSKGQTAKDKSSELDERLDQSETTHFSDVFDMINHAVLKLKLIKPGTGSSGAGIAVR
jgi:hypothetical protein